MGQPLHIRKRHSCTMCNTANVGHTNSRVSPPSASLEADWSLPVHHLPERPSGCRLEAVWKLPGSCMEIACPREPWIHHWLPWPSTPSHTTTTHIHCLHRARGLPCSSTRPTVVYASADVASAYITLRIGTRVPALVTSRARTSSYPLGAAVRADTFAELSDTRAAVSDTRAAVSDTTFSVLMAVVS